MKRILVIFGTRPEAIKMCPLVNELKKRKSVKTYVCVSAQHRDMLDSVLKCFGVVPDFDLNVMQREQTLFDLTEKIMQGVKKVIECAAPDLVLVHGDTTTAFAAALAAFYEKIPIGHVEAGLRTNDISTPFPEEFNRQAVGIMARWHFAPTAWAKNNLLAEGKPENTVFVTGNTVIDALKTTVKSDFKHPILKWGENSRLIMLTVHRRENAGEAMKQIFSALKRICHSFPDVKIFYPVHKNPSIQELAFKELGKIKNLMLCQPLDPVDCHNLMSRCYAVLTDSGGLQEEAAAIGKPTLVLRDRTERPEGVEAGILKLVGTDENSVYLETKRLLTDENLRNRMAESQNPYGNGTASKKIADLICN